MPISGKKLRITSSATDTVYVFQDGDAADATADEKYDDAFRDGAGVNGQTPAGSAFRIQFSALRLRSSHTGREFSFRLRDAVNWNQLGLAPGSLIEFWCDQSDALASADFPSWHSAEAGTSSVKHFLGHVETVERLRDPSGLSEFEVRCVDALRRMDDILFMQSKGASRDVDIPYVVVNVEDIRDPEWVYSLKRYDSAAASPALQIGTGNPKDMTTALLTLGEILGYIQDAYRSELADRGILASSGDDLFDATELASLAIKPPKMVFEDVGLGTAIRRLIENTLLDHAPIFDPRGRKIRIRGVHRDLLTGMGTDVSERIDDDMIRVDDVSLFATSGNGSRVRIQSASDPNLSAVRTVVAVSVLSQWIELDEVIPSGLGLVDDVVYPLYAPENSVPAVVVGLGATSSSTLSNDLQGVYTAVQITSRHRKTERIIVGSESDSSVGEFQVAGAWDDDIDDDYNPIDHGDRHSDAGKNGTGIEIHELSTWDDDGVTKTRVYFSEDQSAFGANHAESVGPSNISEWDGTAFHLLTADGQAVNVSARRVVATVHRFVHDGWIDAPTNTIKRFRVDLDSAVNATIKDEVNDADPDLFELSSSEIYSPIRENGRQAIGRYYRFENTDADLQARDLSTSGCPPSYRTPLEQIVANQRMELPSAQPVGSTTTASNGAFLGLDAQNAAAGFNPAANPFAAATIFRVGQRPQESVNPLTQCLPAVPILQRPPVVEVEKITNEVLAVRYPASGFSGLANQWYGHAKVLSLTTDAFVDSSQESQFEAIATAIWQRVSGPHWSGELSLNGVSDWLGFADLGCRIMLGSGDTGYASGAVTEQSRFWGLLQTIEYDFDAQTASLQFDSNFGDTVAQGMLERLFVSETAQMQEARARIEAIEARERCRAATIQPPSPLNRPGCTVSHGGQSISVKVTPIDPKQEGIGWGGTSISVSGGGSINPANIYGTHAFHPQWIIERDYAGEPFAIQNMTGAVFGGTVSGSAFTVDENAPANPVTLPGQTATTVDELASGLLGADLATPGQSIDVVTTTGSTTTVIQLQGSPLTNDGRYVGGFVEFRNVGLQEARPSYAIASHTGSAITLTGAMSESAPVALMPAKVWPARLPALDATDFPDGGRPIRDKAGNWFVLDSGAITSAELSSGVLIEKGAPDVPTFDLGFAGATHEARGTFDFSGATVEGVADIDTTIATPTNADILTYRSGSGDWRNGPIIGDDSLAFSTSTGIVLKKKAPSSTQAAISVDASGVYMVSASTSDAGAMSATDKAKLDAVDENADVTEGYLTTSVLTTTGDLLYRTGGGSLRRLGIGGTGDFLRVQSGLPVWSTGDQSLNEHALTDVTAISLGSSAAAGRYIDFEATTVSVGSVSGVAYSGNASTVADIAVFGHVDVTEGGITGHALIQTAGGTSAVNAPSGQTAGITIAGGSLVGGTDVLTGSASAATLGVPLQLPNGTSIDEFSTDGTLAGDSDDAVPTEKATRAYVNAYLSPFAYQGWRQAAFSTATDQLIFESGSNDPYNLRFPVPDGKTLLITSIIFKGRSGTTVGTYDYRAGIGTFDSDSSGTLTKTELASGSVAEDSYVTLSDFGSIDAPLMTVVGADGKSLACYFRVETGPGATASSKHTIRIAGVWVDS